MAGATVAPNSGYLLALCGAVRFILHGELETGAAPRRPPIPN